MFRLRPIICFFAIINLFIWLTATSKSYAVTIFHDDFNGNALDGEKWSVDSRGGYVIVSDGALYMDTYDHIVGDRFPVITSNQDPFPVSSDWEMTTSLRYLSGPNITSDGIAIYAEGSNNMIAYLCQQTEWGNVDGGSLYLWDETSRGLIRVWFGDVGKTAHKFTIERSGDFYSAYVDDYLAGTTFNTEEAGRLVIGNANFVTIYGTRWNPLMVDYVNIASETESENIPAPEPGTFLLIVSGITGIFSCKLLRFHGSKTV